MKLVIVESPAKAKTINKYLGSGYEVVASFGHIRDLENKDGAVDPGADFAMKWEIDPKASKRVSEIAASVKSADRLILATDPDREGEAISWHILEALKARGGGRDGAGLCRAPHAGGPPLHRSRARSERTQTALVLSWEPRDGEQRAGGPRSLQHAAIVAVAVVAR